MLFESKRQSIIKDEKLNTTTITFSYTDIEVLMDTLTFAKGVYAYYAELKKKSEDKEDQALAFKHEYSSLLVEELINKIVKEGELADYGGILH